MCENVSDTVDPRVQIELERLNSATDEINRLEGDLDAARKAFRSVLCESTAKIDAIRLKLGLCVEKAKPYYEARFRANEALRQTQIAAMRYEKANSAHSAAREMVFLAEQGLGGRTLDPAWQEMLNHATQRVNESEQERGAAAADHRVACVKHEAMNAKVQCLQKELKRAISQSRPYYEMKAHFNCMLEQQRMRIQQLETNVSAPKLTYAEALRNLEDISDEIHRSRSQTHAPRKQTSFDSAESYVKIDFALPSNSSEWTEINLDVSSPEDDAMMKPKLIRQMTMPTTNTERPKFDKSISNWISRTSVAAAQDEDSAGRRQSLENILGPTGEKVREIWTHGMMMLNIGKSSAGEARQSLDVAIEGKTNKLPSPLEKRMTHMHADDDTSDAESLASVDILNDAQISSLMLDTEISQMCEEILGAPKESATASNSKS